MCQHTADALAPGLDLYDSFEPLDLLRLAGKRTSVHSVRTLVPESLETLYGESEVVHSAVVNILFS